MFCRRLFLLLALSVSSVVSLTFLSSKNDQKTCTCTYIAISARKSLVICGVLVRSRPWTVLGRDLRRERAAREKS